MKLSDAQRNKDREAFQEISSNLLRQYENALSLARAYLALESAGAVHWETWDSGEESELQRHKDIAHEAAEWLVARA